MTEKQIQEKIDTMLKRASDMDDDGMFLVTKAILAYKLKISIEEIFKSGENPLPPLENELDRAIDLLDSAERFNQYKDKNFREFQHSLSTKDEIELETHSLYGSLWVDFDDSTYFDEARDLLTTRLKRNKIDLDWFKGKECLDAGCGGGRYTTALASLGFKSVIGIDMGTKGIEDARKRISNFPLKDKIEFMVGNVLELPFEDDRFDFVFSNGVLHHTNDPEKGIDEIYRVLKPGGKTWLYLYGKDGLENMILGAIRVLLKNVPKEITKSAMILMGVPPNRRFYMLDHFYVPVRKTYAAKEVEKLLRKYNFVNIKQLLRGVEYDLIEKITSNEPFARVKYGEGDLRFIAEKK